MTRTVISLAAANTNQDEQARIIALLEAMAKRATAAQAQVVTDCLTVAKSGSGAFENGSPALALWDRVTKVAANAAQYEATMNHLEGR